jgi:hypothetical protein
VGNFPTFFKTDGYARAGKAVKARFNLGHAYVRGEALFPGYRKVLIQVSCLRAQGRPNDEKGVHSMYFLARRRARFPS